VRGLPLLEPRVMAPMPWWRRRVVTAWARAAAGVATLALAAGVALGPGQREQVFDLTVLNQQHTARVAGESGISTLRGAAP
jgi:endonuclease/exonuclease/phosphatase (EEP) superfamily protein YafD